mmetsp:Transcript_11759/g.19441  ORF Transcript_11759/g.19441 Transcript_11759/m.19441 type:complete len:193 (-) Transcript_11759:123-701(-)
MKRFISSRLLLCLLFLLCLGQLSSGHDEEEKNPAAKVVVISIQNATNTTSPSPTPAATSKPPSSGQPTPAKIIHTHEPTKKYIPPPDDNDDNNDNNNSDEKNKSKNNGVTIFWTLSCLAIAVFFLFYFRNNIAFFLGSVWRNTQRYGCKGFMHSLFPCFYRGLSDGHQPLDQIIFETDESSYTRSNLREGLI